MSIKDNFPVPKIEDCLDVIRVIQWLSSLNLASGYHQLGMYLHDRAKTAFVTSKGLFEFNLWLLGCVTLVLPFPDFCNIIYLGNNGKFV